MAITIPNAWVPRPYQMGLVRAFESGKKRAVCVWHRRAGKDSASLNLTAIAALERVGVYWHMAPTQKQVRKIVWDNIDGQGRRIIDQVFPREIRKSVNGQEMKIELLNGSIWQCVGSDNYNSLVGANPVGVVFSEYSLADPAAWDYLRPILAENGGWALFIYTPRGKSHGYTLLRMAQKNPEWYAQVLTVDDTGAISKDVIEAERKAGMSEDMIQQEFYCSFDAANPGTYYGPQMQRAWQEGRICSVPIEPGIDCETFWDLGMDDSTSIWIMQPVGRECRFVQYYENQDEGLAHYANWLKQWAEDHQVRFSGHHMPHDIEVRELGTGKSRKETAMAMGLKPIIVAKKLEIQDGINAVRRMLPRCWFDEVRCERGISALTEYSKDYDEKLKVFKSKPRHDWASHGADAFRTFAVSYRDKMPASSSLIRHASTWSPFG